MSIRSTWRWATFFSAALVLAAALPAGARTLMTQQQALATAFPRGAVVKRQPVFLNPAQRASAQKISGVEFDDGLIVRYVGVLNGRIAGYAYFDSHRVRTLPETLMIVVTPDAKVSRIEILSFSEPSDYFPRERWLDQFEGRKLDDELSLRKAIRPISGASLTGRAIVNASRKILALHGVIGAAAP